MNETVRTQGICQRKLIFRPIVFICFTMVFPILDMSTNEIPLDQLQIVTSWMCLTSKTFKQPEPRSDSSGIYRGQMVFNPCPTPFPVGCPWPLERAHSLLCCWWGRRGKSLQEGCFPEAFCTLANLEASPVNADTSIFCMDGAVLATWRSPRREWVFY